MLSFFPIQSVYSQSIRENTQPTNPLFVVTATDNDQEDYGNVRYSFPPQEMYLQVDNITVSDRFPYVTRTVLMSTFQY